MHSILLLYSLAKLSLVSNVDGREHLEPIFVCCKLIKIWRHVTWFFFKIDRDKTAICTVWSYFLSIIISFMRCFLYVLESLLCQLWPRCLKILFWILHNNMVVAIILHFSLASVQLWELALLMRIGIFHLWFLIK